MVLPSASAGRRALFSIFGIEAKRLRQRDRASGRACPWRCRGPSHPNNCARVRAWLAPAPSPAPWRQDHRSLLRPRPLAPRTSASAARSLAARATETARRLGLGRCSSSSSNHATNADGVRRRLHGARDMRLARIFDQRTFQQLHVVIDVERVAPSPRSGICSARRQRFQCARRRCCEAGSALLVTRAKCNVSVMSSPRGQKPAFGRQRASPIKVPRSV